MGPGTEVGGAWVAGPGWAAGGGALVRGGAEAGTWLGIGLSVFLCADGTSVLYLSMCLTRPPALMTTAALLCWSLTHSRPSRTKSSRWPFDPVTGTASSNCEDAVLYTSRLPLVSSGM